MISPRVDVAAIAFCVLMRAISIIGRSSGASSSNGLSGCRINSGIAPCVSVAGTGSRSSARPARSALPMLSQNDGRDFDARCAALSASLNFGFGGRRQPSSSDGFFAALRPQPAMDSIIAAFCLSTASRFSALTPSKFWAGGSSSTIALTPAGYLEAYSRTMLVPSECPTRTTGPAIFAACSSACRSFAVLSMYGALAAPSLKP